MKLFRIVGIAIGVLILLAAAVYAWGSHTAKGKLTKTYAVHTRDFPIPFPGATEYVGQRENAEAVERGKHLVAARYACTECHGSNFGGGVMVDNAAIGRLLGPNLTAGRGSVTQGYRAADWDRIVRHGIKRNGRPALMPSQDFQEMTDQELSDIVSFIRSQPPVDSQVPLPKLGPVGTMLIATGKLPLSADVIRSHDKLHAIAPPKAEPTADFGRHLAATCMGCHGDDLGGGTIVGGDPSWPPAANLTSGANGLGGWTLADFTRAMREGKRPDGTAFRQPMANVSGYTQKMTETELNALWNYLKSVPAVADRD